jgi:general secretion pathway protein G
MLMRLKKIDRDGFSLAEVMVVLLVIGVLSTIVTVSLSKARIESQFKKAETELQLLSSAIEQLAWDTGMLPRALSRVTPGSSECWDLSTDDAGLMGTDGDFTNWKGPYIRDIGNDPWGNPYFFDPDYRINGVFEKVVGSFGPNGVGRNRYDSDDIYVLVAN